MFNRIRMPSRGLTKYDDEDRGVDIIVTEKVEVILSVNLGIGSKSNQDNPSQCEENVAQHHEVLDYALTTVLHVSDLLPLQ